MVEPLTDAKEEAERIVREWDDLTRGSHMPWHQQRKLLVERVAAYIERDRELLRRCASTINLLHNAGWLEQVADSWLMPLLSDLRAAKVSE